MRPHLLTLILFAVSVGLGSAGPYADPDHGFTVDVPDGWTAAKKEGTKDVQLWPSQPAGTLVEVLVRPGRSYQLDEQDAVKKDLKTKLGRSGAVKDVPWRELAYVSGCATHGWGLESRTPDGASVVKWCAFLDPGRTVEEIIGVQVHIQYAGVDAALVRAPIDAILASLRFRGTSLGPKPSRLPPAPDDPWTEFLDCFAIQGQLSGATEMWALEKNTTPKPISPELIAQFIATGYVKPFAENPANYVPTPDGRVTCQVHGDRMGTLKGVKPRPPGR